jgi:hypothetical protein
VAEPVIRRSRVDEPSQMLPPSMVGGGMRDNTAPTGGRGNTTQGRTATNSGTSASSSLTTITAPITVKESPSTHADSAGALLAVASNGKPISVGMPQGVFGLKGLSLSTGPDTNSPGPVIVSNTDNVKLDAGTQILLHVLKVEIPAKPNPEKKPAK